MKLDAEVLQLRQREKELMAALSEARQKLEMLPADWQTDSSLETWFPFTAEILKRQQAAIGAYEQQVTQQAATIAKLKAGRTCKCSNPACDCQWRHTCNCPPLANVRSEEKQP
jgi:hypothetical protein